MEHSLLAYIERQSTNALQGFLWQVMQQNTWGSYANVVPEIFRSIQERGDAIAPQLLEAWNAWQKNQ